MEIAPRETLKLRQPESGDMEQIEELISWRESFGTTTASAVPFLCDYFQETCVVAESGTEIVGFLFALKPQKYNDRIFIHHIVTARRDETEARIGIAMILEVLKRQICHDTSYLELVAGNTGALSKDFFKSVAERLSTRMTEVHKQTHAARHERNVTFIRIGPINTVKRYSTRF